jgi:phosphohistidine swiveling domain-containing protein
MHQPQHLPTRVSEQREPLVLIFDEIDASLLAQVGGKAANLGEMTRAGLPIPPGFCVTTAAYTRAASRAGLEPILDQLAAARTDDLAQLESCAAAAREKLLAAPISEEIMEAVTEAYQHFMSSTPISAAPTHAQHDSTSSVPIPVAVRSSATAEDLPFASFAGQQDTYLNIVGIEAVLDAIRRCWASLWTARAVSYRANNGIDHRAVRLAVVVQQMIEARVAGVLFTANPLTGHRRQAVIDANPGLGEAVVSGAVNPDHFVVNTASGKILERRLGDKRVVIRSTPGGGTRRVETAQAQSTFCLTDEQVRELARLGARVEAHYGPPQDTEWAIDAAGKLWLTQARPITTLYPLPANAPASDDELRVYFSLNVFQGVFQPFTPMGIAAFQLIGSMVAGLFGLAPRDRLSGPGALVEAGSRLFLDVTPALRTKIGRKLLIGAMNFGEARSGELVQQLLDDPHLSLKPTPRWRLLRAFGPFAIRAKAPLYLLLGLFKPSALVARMQRARKGLEELAAASPESLASDPAERLRTLEDLVTRRAEVLFHTFPPILLSGLGSLGLASRLLKGIAAPGELQIVLRALPHNPTTEMDLDLWALSREVAADASAARHVSETTPEHLAREYRAGTLPQMLQQGLAEFLYHYGHRSVAEIDLGLPRWRENPAHILGVLANYLQLTDPVLAPDAQFRRGAREAETMVAELIRRAARKGRLRGLLVALFLKRARALAGLREMPKFCLILLLFFMRKVLQSVGKELAGAGRLENGEDIFFLSLREAHTALDGMDMRGIVRERRAIYTREFQRRHVPRILLSDGTEPAPATTEGIESQGTLRGTPASPGNITGRARVILDPTGTYLEPGEILVAPSTDPGWTPLFLTAGGLVMEMGGAISHGAVVAREYGIPAVVGVPGATERITTGQRITVDGSRGVVILEEKE